MLRLPPTSTLTDPPFPCPTRVRSDLPGGIGAFENEPDRQPRQLVRRKVEEAARLQRSRLARRLGELEPLDGRRAVPQGELEIDRGQAIDRKSTRLNSSH